MSVTYYVVTFIFFITLVCAEYIEFPKQFEFGIATSAFQIEGAWNEDGKGESWWDNYTHKSTSKVLNHDNGDIACDSYHRYKEDVALVADLGVSFYRISISWSRILPTGYADQINEKGIEYYKNVFQEILKYNMTPIVTLYHWDLPQNLYDDGLDWLNPKLVDVFVNYSRIVISRFPEVGRWITINEPRLICTYGYNKGMYPPLEVSSGTLEYQCAYVILKSHAAVYHMYKEEFPDYKAEMSLTSDCEWAELKTNAIKDQAAVERLLQFQAGIYYHPVFIGDWPKVVKERIHNRSMAANYTKSRLPEFTAEEIDYIKGTYDFLGVNFYYTQMIESNLEGPPNVTSFENDVGIINYEEYRYPPRSLRNVLNWLKKEYGNQNILITEIGTSDPGVLDDDMRINFFKKHFCQILDAIHKDSINITGITAWSLMDNFEWESGYTKHFGIYYIDHYNDVNLTRIPKKSVAFYKELIKTRRLHCGGESSGSTLSKNISPMVFYIFVFLALINNIIWNSKLI